MPRSRLDRGSRWTIAAACVAIGLLTVYGLFFHRGRTVNRREDPRDQVGIGQSVRHPEMQEPVVLSAADQQMPADAVFLTNQGFRVEQSLRSRLKTLDGITNFVANARAAGLGIYASGPAEMMVRSGANNVAVAKTKNAFFDVMYSESLTPSVVEMHGLSRDKYGLPYDVRQFADDVADPHVDAVRAWADTNAYPILWRTTETDAAVSNFLAAQIRGFADRYLLESRSQVEVSGYKTPFVTYTYAATNVFKDFSNMNRDAIQVTLRVGGPDLITGSDLPPTGAVLVNYSDPGVVWRMNQEGDQAR